MDKIHEVHNENPPKGYMWSGRRIKTKVKQEPDQTICSQQYGPTCQKQITTKVKAAMGSRKTESGQCVEIERHPLCRFG